MTSPHEPAIPVPYEDPEFLNSDEARPLRILSEYLAPLRAFERQQVKDTVVFFGSARIQPTGPFGRYYEEARELARLVTEWSMTVDGPDHHHIVCSGGGPGIMEAANRGARDAGGRSIGLNIGLPHEQRPNPFITEGLSFQFHYFFMRKLWFAHLTRALVVFPGGFGTLDELSELLTLQQTGKLERKMLILLYGTEFWNEILNFKALAKYGMISPEDLGLFQFVDDPQTALSLLTAALATPPLEEAATPEKPAFASSKTPAAP
ncbi:MAG TPA: TIGR00730 family Rossman fold protein [Polyangia bacterium]